jgi:hypothetical protein
MRRLLVAVVLVAAALSPRARAEDLSGVDAMLRRFADGDAAARREVAAALGAGWPEGAVGAPLLVEALDDDDPEVRAAAERALETLGTQGADRIAAWLRHEWGAGQGEARNVAEILRALGARVTARDVAAGVAVMNASGMVLAAAVPSDEPERLAVYGGWLLAAHRASGKGPWAADTVDAARAALAVRGRAALSPAAARPVARRVLQLVRHERPEWRWLAVGLLRRLRSAGAEVERALALLAADAEADVARAARVAREELFGSAARAVAKRDGAPAPLALHRPGEPYLDVPSLDRLRAARTRDAALAKEVAERLEAVLAEPAADPMAEGAGKVEDLGWPGVAAYAQRHLLADALGRLDAGTARARSLLEPLAASADPAMRYVARRALTRLGATPPR